MAISAATGEGLDQLYSEMEQQVKSWRLRVKLVVPNHLSALVAELHRVGRVLDISYQGDAIKLTAHVPPQLQGKIRPYLVEEEAEEGLAQKLSHEADGEGASVSREKFKVGPRAQ